MVISARVEAELRELDQGEADEMRAELGIERSGLERLIRAAFELLDLITFFTADPDREAMAGHCPVAERPTTPPAASTATSSAPSSEPR